MDSSRYSCWGYLMESDTVDDSSSGSRVGTLPEPKCPCEHHQSGGGHWKLRPWLRVQLPLETPGTAAIAIFWGCFTRVPHPHSMAFPEYLLKEAAMRHLKPLVRGEGQTKASLSSYVL